MVLSSLSFQRAALHDAYRAGLTPQAVMAEALRRLEAAADPGIFLDVTPQADVQAAITALPGFDPKAFPLWGLPVAVKDNIALAGRPMTAACPAFSPVPYADAEVVRRLPPAGALIRCQPNPSQFATGAV